VTVVKLIRGLLSLTVMPMTCTCWRTPVTCSYYLATCTPAACHLLASPCQCAFLGVYW